MRRSASSAVVQSSDSWNHQKIHHRKSEQAGDKSLAYDIADHSIMVQLADHQLRQPEQSNLGSEWNRSKALFRSTEVKPWTQLKTHAVQNRIGLQVGVVHWKTFSLKRVPRLQRIPIEVFSIEYQHLAEHIVWTNESPVYLKRSNVRQLVTIRTKGYKREEIQTMSAAIAMKAPWKSQDKALKRLLASL